MVSFTGEGQKEAMIWALGPFIDDKVLLLPGLSVDRASEGMYECVYACVYVFNLHLYLFPYVSVCIKISGPFLVLFLSTFVVLFWYLDGFILNIVTYLINPLNITSFPPPVLHWCPLHLPRLWLILGCSHDLCKRHLSSLNLWYSQQNNLFKYE